MCKLVTILAGILYCCATAFAQTPSVNKLRLTVTTAKECLSKAKQESNSVESSKETWAYAVTIKNGAFQELENLKVEYRVYVKDDFHGPKGTEAQMKRKEGTLEIQKLLKLGEYPFYTTEVEVDKSELKA